MKYKILLIILCLFFTGCQKTDVINDYKEKEESIPQITQTPREVISEYEVPILMYHYIRDYNDPNDEIGTNLSVSPNNFEKQIVWLKDNNYETVNFDYFFEPHKLENNKKPIIITFDDGYKDAFENAFPILKKYDFKGIFYIVSKFMDKDNYLSWEDAKKMSKENMVIAAHTVSHLNLAELNQEKLTQEIINNKIDIKNNIGSETVDFCYPAGKYNEKVIATLKEQNFKTATTVKNGIASQNSDLFELPRIRITNNTNLEKILQ